MKTLKEKCQLFVLEQFLVEAPKGKNFEYVIGSLRHNGEYADDICDTYWHLNYTDVADMMESHAESLIKFCSNLIKENAEKQAPAGSAMSGLKKAIDDLQGICDGLDADGCSECDYKDHDCFNSFQGSGCKVSENTQKEICKKCIWKNACLETPDGKRCKEVRQEKE